MTKSDAFTAAASWLQRLSPVLLTACAALSSACGLSPDSAAPPTATAPSAPLQGKGAEMNGRLSDVPNDLDIRTAKLSAAGSFHGSLRRDDDSPVLNRLQIWTLILTTPHGEPLEAASIRVDGGMPQHDHGLPTQPHVRAADAPGQYLVEGVKFHMRGWWQLTFDITVAETRDLLTYNIVYP